MEINYRHNVCPTSSQETAAAVAHREWGQFTQYTSTYESSQEASLEWMSS